MPVAPQKKYADLRQGKRHVGFCFGGEARRPLPQGGSSSTGEGTQLPPGPDKKRSRPIPEKGGAERQEADRGFHSGVVAGES